MKLNSEEIHKKQQLHSITENQRAKRKIHLKAKSPTSGIDLKDLKATILQKGRKIFFSIMLKDAVELFQDFYARGVLNVTVNEPTISILSVFLFFLLFHSLLEFV